MIGIDPPSDADLYEKLRDNGLSHEDAVHHVELRRRAMTPGADESTGLGEGISSAAVKGLTFGFNDEIEGATQAALGGFKPGVYTEARDLRRNAEKNFAKANPKTALASEMVGGLLPTLATMGGSAAASAAAEGGVVARGAKSVATGAALSGLVGAGNAEGPIASQLRQIRDAAAAGGAMTIGGAAVGKVGGGLIRGVANAVGKPIGGASAQADRLLLQAIKRDDETPTSILAAYRARQSAKPETIADLAGRSTKGLASAAQGIPSKATNLLADTFEERAANQPARLARDLESGIGVGREDTGQLLIDLEETAKRTAKPLYDQAYQHGTVTDPRINELLQLPPFQEAWARGQRIARLEGRQLASIDAPDVQSLDYVKRGLDDILDNFGDTSLGKQERAAIRQLKNEMLDRVDQAVPAYQAARSTYAGAKEFQEALESGQEILKKDPRVVAREIAALTPGEQHRYKLGALDAVRRKMDATKDGRDLTRVIFGDAETRQRLQSLFPTPEAFEAFGREIGQEATMAGTRNAVLSGSRTAPLQAQIAEIGGVDPGALAQAASGNPTGAIMSHLMKLAKQRGQGLTGEVADQLGKNFTAGIKDPRDLERLLQVLEHADNRATQRATAVRRTTRSAASRVAPHTTMQDESRRQPVHPQAADRWEQLVAQGINPDEATRRVQQEFGLSSNGTTQ